ncbi:hypothetical protein HMI55_006634 [Coelomomyces lativittatus]|nr:hypothetical protein HMI55_006634 [Coelomomyces lativittatus]
MASDRSTSTTILATNYLKPRKDAYINKTEAIKNAHPSPFLFLKCKKKHSFTSSHLGSNFQHHLGTHNKTFIDLEISTSLKPNVTGQKEIKKSTPHSPHPKSSTCHRPGNAAVRNALSSRPKKYASFTSLAIAPFKSKTSPNSLHSANHAEIFDPLKNKITYPDLSKKSCSPNKISNSISEETLKLGNNFSLSLHPVKSTGIIPKSTSPLSLESKIFWTFSSTCFSYKKQDSCRIATSFPNYKKV